MKTDLKTLRDYFIDCFPINDKPNKKTVKGYRVIYPETPFIEYFVSKSIDCPDLWRVSESKTGKCFGLLNDGETRQEAIDNVRKYLINKGFDKFLELYNKQFKVYCFDLDNTLCETEGTDYKNSKPIKKHIDKVNQLCNEGYTIKIFTGRGSVSGRDWRNLTEGQLKLWEVKYHELIMGKPNYDIFVDDKCINTKEFFK